MSRVVLSSPAQLGPAVRRLGKNLERAAVRAMVSAARYGATQAVATSAKTQPRPRARGTYERSFKVTRLPNGAALSNAAKHAIFVEVGRRKGKRPPVEAILSWMRAKKIGKGLRKQKRLMMALRIARKIGKHGTKGRFVLKRTMPKIAKRVLIEIDAEFRREFARAAKR